MKKTLKLIGLGFLFLNILILILAVTFFIPNKYIYKNLKSGTEYYMEEGIRPSIKGLICTNNDASADSTALNIIMNNDSNNLAKSVFYTSAYRDFKSQDFIKMANDTIIKKEPANYNYNRYWHGYQILWRPMLVFFNVNTIRYICMAIYICLLIFFVYKSIKEKYTGLAIGMVLMNIFHIIPFGFNALEYIPVFLITIIISCLILCKKIQLQPALILSGISVAFFDFWTSETLTLTVPCVIYAYISNKENKLKIKEIIYGIIYWVSGYGATFLYKWGLSSLIYKENFFKEAIDKYNMHSFSDNLFSNFFSVKYNINILLLNQSSISTTFKWIVIFIIMLAIFIYFFKKENSSIKYILTISSIALIPYIRYIVFKGHSREYVFFTYRAQLVVVLIITLLICETNIKLYSKKKGHLK